MTRKAVWAQVLGCISRTGDEFVKAYFYKKKYPCVKLIFSR